MIKLLACVALLGLAPSAIAQSPSMPPPPMPGPVSMAVPYMQIGGEADVYEVTSSEIAVRRAASSDVKRFAAMLIEHHTATTNDLLAHAKTAGLTPPPAVLGQGARVWIDALLAAAPADFDRVYLSQQVPAHEQALAVHQGYAASGDSAELKMAASAAVPIVERHLAEARRLASR